MKLPTLTFYSNFLNHHQKPLCDAFFKHLGSNFTFVSTIEMPQVFSKNGYDDFSNIAYNLNAFQNEDAYQKAIQLGFDSDIVITGSAPEVFTKERLRSNKLTFRYGERDFKKGDYQKFDPRRLLWYAYLHTRHRNKNLYMLCNSAFKPNDMKWVFAYPEKMYKWGYFPKVEPLEIENILAAKRHGKIRLLYVARLIKWKHPSLVIELAKRLKSANYDFDLQIVGSGLLEQKLKEDVLRLGLSGSVSFLGNHPNEHVLKLMQEANIFIFASDRNEGWGAVANEAMANGCTVVASNEIGAIPYLIKNKVNGLIFESKNANDLFEKTKQLIEERTYCENLAINAYKTVKTTWSPENAATNFFQLSNSFLQNRRTEITEGPCSKANPTPLDWYLKDLA